MTRESLAHVAVWALIVLLGFTQWLIEHNVYDPNAPGGKPTTQQAAPACPAPTTTP